MAETQSVAEGMERPFEVRYAGALALLKVHCQNFRTLFVRVAQSKEERARSAEVLYATYIEYGGDILSCPNKESYLAWLCKKDDEFLTLAWENGLRSVRRDYGFDAFSFALTELKKQSPAN